MRCTAKKHFDIAAEANIALIVQVKDNQPALHQVIAGIAAATAPSGCTQSHNTGRSRNERRIVSVFAPAKALAKTDWHPHVAVIIHVKREVFTRSSKTSLLHRSARTASRISNMPLAATRVAEAIRAHWRIETISHYSRDVAMG